MAARGIRFDHHEDEVAVESVMCSELFVLFERRYLSCWVCR